MPATRERIVAGIERMARALGEAYDTRIAVDIEAVLKEEAQIQEELAAVEAKMADYLSQLGLSD